MKKICILISLIMTLVLPFSAFAEQETLPTVNTNLVKDAANYDLSNIREVAKLYSNDDEFKKLVKEFTEEKVNQTINQAVNRSKNKKDKSSKEISSYLEKLKELSVIDSNYKLITDTKTDKSEKKQNSAVTEKESVNQQDNAAKEIQSSTEQSKMTSAAIRSYSSFDLRGKCITNANTIDSTYAVNYSLGLILYKNFVSAAAYAYSSTGYFFASKVKTGGAWDYKQTLGWDTSYYVTIGGYKFLCRGEDIGNFHYGYTGAVIFPDFVLKSAAGLVQIISGTSSISYYSSYFDDPNDQTWIQEGIDYYHDGTI